MSDIPFILTSIPNGMCRRCGVVTATDYIYREMTSAYAMLLGFTQGFEISKVCARCKDVMLIHEGWGYISLSPEEAEVIQVMQS